MLNFPSTACAISEPNSHLQPIENTRLRTRLSRVSKCYLQMIVRHTHVLIQISHVTIFSDAILTTTNKTFRAWICAPSCVIHGSHQNSSENVFLLAASVYCGCKLSIVRNSSVVRQSQFIEPTYFRFKILLFRSCRLFHYASRLLFLQKIGVSAYARRFVLSILPFLPFVLKNQLRTICLFLHLHLSIHSMSTSVDCQCLRARLDFPKFNFQRVRIEQ
jgi:hypothetical protein